LDKKVEYTAQDCVETDISCSIKGKVIILKHETLPFKEQNQLYFCLCGNGAGANPKGSVLFLISLNTGELSLERRDEVVSILKPEFLPDKAKLMLSQIRPVGALDIKSHEPQYSGYCFLTDGRYTCGVWLCSLKEVQDYIEIQKDYQHKIMICDRNDFCVFEMVEGKVIYPTQEILDAHRAGQEPGGMELKL
jgi:hypothetical protein